MSGNLRARGGGRAQGAWKAKTPLESHVSKMCLDVAVGDGYKDIPWHTDYRVMG